MWDVESGYVTVGVSRVGEEAKQEKLLGVLLFLGPAAPSLCGSAGEASGETKLLAGVRTAGDKQSRV